MKKLLIVLLTFTFCLSAKAQKGINLIENAENGFVKETLGDSVNSTAQELLPLISADGKTLLFCRNAHPENTGDNDEDIWYSTWNEEGKSWTKAKNFGAPINNEGNNSTFGYTPDGNNIYVMGEYYPNGVYKGGGVSISGKDENGKWYVPSRLNIDNYYNDSHFANYCMASGQNVLIMSLTRKGGMGGNDLWVSFKKDEGLDQWTEPLLMGKTINSIDHEASPFLAADNKTLYFASSGLKGYGSFDLFVSKRLDDTWTNWSEPKNLGPEINSKQLDAFYTIPAKGDYAYMVSEENAIGGTDVFRIKLPEAAKPEPVVLVSGKLTCKDGKVLVAEINYKEEGKETGGFAGSSPEDGTFKMVLNTGKKYELTFSGQKLPKTTEILDLTSYSEYKEIEKNFTFTCVEPNSDENTETTASTSEVTTTNSTNENEGNDGNETFKPVNIYFAYNIHSLSAKAKNKLDKIAEAMNKNKSLKVELLGHTDSKGDNEYNLALGERRTTSTRDYLISKGISSERIKILSYGEEKPAETNKTGTGRAKNRRVEINSK